MKVCLEHAFFCFLGNVHVMHTQSMMTIPLYYGVADCYFYSLTLMDDI